MFKRSTLLLLAVLFSFCLSSCMSKRLSDNSLELEDSDERRTTSAQSESVSDVQTEHIHNYADATCLDPMKCSCGVTAGAALGHDFISATCTSPQICKRCSATLGSELGHDFSVATCTVPSTCVRCGITQGEALGHSYVDNHCTICGKVDPDSLPVRLESLFLIDSSNGNAWHQYKYDSTSLTDSFGNIYDGAHCYLGCNYEQYSMHNLEGKYRYFNGSIVAPQNSNAKRTYSIRIYVDGELKYSKTCFSKTSGKVDFSVDVDGGTTLMIKVVHEQSAGDSNEDVCIVNAQLLK